MDDEEIKILNGLSEDDIVHLHNRLYKREFSQSPEQRAKQKDYRNSAIGRENRLSHRKKYRNSEKGKAAAKKWLDKHGKEYYRLYKLGIVFTEEQRISMYAAQNGLCYLCGEPGELDGKGIGRTTMHLVVDHIHNTNKVRGLAHSRCNMAIGILGDNAAAIMKVALNLQKVEDKINGRDTSNT